MNLLKQLARRQLIFVTGKGGVGKSTLAATLGRLLVESGEQVLLLEVDPRETLHALLDVEPSGGEVKQAGPGLFLQNLRPRDVLDRLVREQLRVEFLVRRVLASPVYRHFAEGAPGLQQVAVLGHALRALRGKAGDGCPQVDRVVIDAPATGHGVSMLAAPGLVADVIRDGPLGRMGRELAGFVADPERCAIVIATLAEEMPVQEAIDLIRSLDERLGRRPELLVVNGLYPSLGGAEATSDPELEPWYRRRKVNERELLRLSQAWQGPRVELPLTAASRGPALVEALAAPLAAGLAPRAEQR